MTTKCVERCFTSFIIIGKTSTKSTDFATTYSFPKMLAQFGATRTFLYGGSEKEMVQLFWKKGSVTYLKVNYICVHFIPRLFSQLKWKITSIRNLEVNI